MGLWNLIKIIIILGWHVKDMCDLLSKKFKIKFIFEEVWNYIYKKCMSYKVNLFV